MKHITEPKRKIPVYGNFDVVVCGGGPAGCGSALSAARNGAKVLLIEQTGCLGGMGTAGLIPCFAPFTYAKEPLAKGIALEVLNKLKALDGVGNSPKSSTSWIGIDPEKLKLLYDNLLEESGIKVLFFTAVSGVIKNRGKITAVIIENKKGRQAVTGKTFIDATGDADIAAKAGVPFKKGDNKGKMQPVTVCFSAAGIDSNKFKILRNATFKGKNSLMTEKTLTSAEGKSLPRLKFGEYRFIAQKDLGGGVWGFNFGHIFDIDGTDTDRLSFAIAYGRKIANNFIAYARKHIPGFKNASLIQTSQMLGVRETRRIKGLHMFTFKDYMSQNKFSDTIAVYDYPIDIHVPKKSRSIFNKMEREFTKDFVLPYGKYYSVPFRSLVPVNIDNLLVAGRSVSTDRITQGALRVMPLCLCMGQAAGLAAAMAVKKGNSFRDTDTMLLREKLTKQGARVD